MMAKAVFELQAAQRSHQDRLLRLAADYENYKKRSRRDLSDAARRAEEKVVLEFLPVLDNLERALFHASPEAAGLVAGVQMVQKQFLATLDKYEISPFDSQGLPFDPERHEAIQQLVADAAAGTVCAELRRGYLRGERLVRPASVAVSLGPRPAGEAGATAGSAPEAPSSGPSGVEDGDPGTGRGQGDP
jgi:molecular chaperone GrpE